MDVFDRRYWDYVQAVVDCVTDECANCQLPVEVAPHTATGYTHTGEWQGVRCPNRLCGATPKGLTDG